MKKSPNTAYRSSAMKEIEDSNVFAFHAWQNQDEEREYHVQDFIDFIARDIEADDAKEDKKIREALKIMQTALPLFLGIDEKKAQAGEMELLAKWKKSVG